MKKQAEPATFNIRRKLTLVFTGIAVMMLLQTVFAFFIDRGVIGAEWINTLSAASVGIGALASALLSCERARAALFALAGGGLMVGVLWLSGLLFFGGDIRWGGAAVIAGVVLAVWVLGALLCALFRK